MFVIPSIIRMISITKLINTKFNCTFNSIQIVFNINCNDYTSGYRGFNLRKLKNFNLNSISSKGYSFFMETIYQLNKKGVKIKQIPIYFPRRKHGKSKIPRVELFRTLINVIILYFKG